MSQILEGVHFGASTCLACVRTRSNTGEKSWRNIYVLVQISFEPGFGAYQGLAQKIKVPFSRIFSFFLQFLGFKGDFKTRAKPRYAPNSG